MKIGNTSTASFVVGFGSSPPYVSRLCLVSVAAFEEWIDQLPQHPTEGIYSLADRHLLTRLRTETSHHSRGMYWVHLVYGSHDRDSVRRSLSDVNLEVPSQDAIAYSGDYGIAFRAVASFIHRRRNSIPGEQVCDKVCEWFPLDGFWKGLVKCDKDGIESLVFELMDDQLVRCELTYCAGPEDLKWMEERDIDYLTLLEGGGRLRELEPTVWCLREIEVARGRSIGEWWHEKLQLPESELRSQLDGLLSSTIEG